jgi:hypothetical protein
VVYHDSLYFQRDRYLYDIAMNSPSSAIAVGSAKSVRTTDGGRSWTPPGNSSNYLLEVEFLDSLVGYATGFVNMWPSSPPLVQRTTDGGATWRKGEVVNEPPHDYMVLRLINTIEPLDGGSAIGMGSDGFYMTSDTSRTWTIVESAPAWLVSMARTGEGGVVGIGENGEIIRAQRPPVDTSTTRIVGESGRTSGLALEQNSPNPFASSTIIRFTLPNAGHATLTIHDPLGRVVAVPVDALLGAGRHSVEWGTDLPGVYIYTLRHEGGSLSKIMICR